MFRDVAAARARIRKIVQLHRIILVSWSAVHWLAWALSDRHWFDAVVLDESGYAGNRTTRRWQVARALCKHAGCVWALNGTPMTGKPESVFGQSWLIDQGATFGRTLGDFRQRFLRPSRFGPQGRVLDWGDPTPAQQAEMQGCFERLWIPVRAKDWLQLPDLIVNDVFVDLQEQHWRAVSALVRGALAQVGGASVLPASAGAGVAKAAQLCGGDLYDDAGESSHLHDEKLDAVEELVEQADGGVLLFWLYKNHEASLRKRLGRALVGIDEPDAVARWARGEVKVLGAHPEKVAVGLNLQHGGSTQIWFGPTYSSFWWEQGVARTQRQGQEAPSVIVHRVMTRHPFERGIVDVCEGKLSLLEALMSVAKGPEYGE